MGKWGTPALAALEPRDTTAKYLLVFVPREWPMRQASGHLGMATCRNLEMSKRQPRPAACNSNSSVASPVRPMMQLPFPPLGTASSPGWRSLPSIRYLKDQTPSSPLPSSPSSSATSATPPSSSLDTPRRHPRNHPTYHHNQHIFTFSPLNSAIQHVEHYSQGQGCRKRPQG